MTTGERICWSNSTCEGETTGCPEVDECPQSRLWTGDQSCSMCLSSRYFSVRLGSDLLSDAVKNYLTELRLARVARKVSYSVLSKVIGFQRSRTNLLRLLVFNV